MQVEIKRVGVRIDAFNFAGASRHLSGGKRSQQKELESTCKSHCGRIISGFRVEAQLVGNFNRLALAESVSQAHKASREFSFQE